MHGSGPSRAWRLVAATAALLASVTALGAVSLASAPDAAASVACVANAPAGAESTCGLTAWVGSTYAGGAHPNGSTPTLTTAGVFSALSSKAGSDATISLDWSSSAADYGEPSACASSLSIPAGTVRGSTTFVYCGYWVLGQNAADGGTHYTGTVSVTDLIDWWEGTPTGHYAWRMPYGTTSAVYGCITGSTTCNDGSTLTPYLSLANGNLCESAYLGGSRSPTTVWCSDSGARRTTGTWLANTQFADWPSFRNSSWNQPQHDGSAGSGSLELQWTGNLVVRSGSGAALWASQDKPLCMPVTSTPSGGCTRSASEESAVTAPGSYETMTLFSQSSTTNQPSNPTHICRADSIGYETFANPRDRGPSPTDCSAQQCPVDSVSVHCSFNVSVPPDGGDVFVQAYVFEWNAAGGYTQGGAYAFPLAHSQAILDVVGGSTTPTTTSATNGLSCWDGTAWTTSCSAPTGTKITVALHLSPTTILTPSDPRGGYSSTDYFYGRCLSVCTLHITASPANVGGGLVTRVWSTGSMSATCGIGVEMTGYIKQYPSLSHTFTWQPPDGWTPDTARFMAYYVPTCGDSGPTELWDRFIPPHGGYTAGPEPTVTASWYDHTVGIGFSGSTGASSYWVAGSTHNPTMPNGQTSLMMSGTSSARLGVTNDTAGTYTVYGHYIWYSYAARYGLDDENQYAAGRPGPDYTITLSFGTTSGSSSPPTHSTTTGGTTSPPAPTRYTTTTTLTGTPNPAYVGEAVTLTSTTTFQGSPVTGGTVSFSYAGTQLCSGIAVSDGSASCATTALPAGTDTVTATYSGVAGKYTPGSGETTIHVGAHPPPVYYPT